MSDGLSDYDREHIGDIVAGEGDWFQAELIRLARKAHGDYRRRLAMGFPDTVAAVQAWEDAPYGPR